MNAGEVYIAHVVRGIIVLDLAFTKSDSVMVWVSLLGDTDLLSSLRIVS